MANKSLVAEFWEFVKYKKILWLYPVILLLLLMGVLVVATESSTVSAFVYAMF